jgi:hypothetical protein
VSALVDERFAPLVLAIGRAVLGAAALEKVLLVDVVRRRGASEGLSKRLGEDLARLERLPAGPLVGALVELGIPESMSDRIDEVLQRRNWLVHRFVLDPDVLRVFMTGTGVDDLVSRVEQLALDCEQLGNELAPAAFAETEALLGATMPELLAWAKSVDLDQLEDPLLRAQLELIQSMTETEDP